MEPLVNQDLANALSGLLTRLLANVDSRAVGDSNIPFKKPVIVTSHATLFANKHYHFVVAGSYVLPDAAVGDFLKITRNVDVEPTFSTVGTETIRWVNGTMSQFIYNLSSEIILIKVSESNWELLVATPVATATSTNTIVVDLPATITAPGRYLLKGNGDLTLVTPMGQPDGLVYDLFSPVGNSPTIRTTAAGFITDDGIGSVLSFDAQRVTLITCDDKYHI